MWGSDLVVCTSSGCRRMSGETGPASLDVDRHLANFGPKALKVGPNSADVGNHVLGSDYFVRCR